MKMRFLPTFRAVVRLAGKHLLTPWRSPLVRWRMETYGVLDENGQLVRADQITPRMTLSFFLKNRKELARFLRWASRI